MTKEHTELNRLTQMLDWLKIELKRYRVDEKSDATLESRTAKLGRRLRLSHAPEALAASRRIRDLRLIVATQVDDSRAKAEAEYAEFLKKKGIEIDG